MRKLAIAGSGTAEGGPVRAVHVVDPDELVVAGVHHVDPARGIDADARRIVELSDIRTIGTEAGPVGAVHVVDADDAGVVRVGHVDPARGIHRDAVGAVELPDVAALRSIRDEVGPVQVVGAEDLAGVREIERRVRGVVAGRAASDHPVGSIDLGSGAVDRLRRSVHRQGAAEGSREGEAAGHVAASAAARAMLHRRAVGKGGVDRDRFVGGQERQVPNPRPSPAQIARSGAHLRAPIEYLFVVMSLLVWFWCVAEAGS